MIFVVTDSFTVCILLEASLLRWILRPSCLIYVFLVSFVTNSYCALVYGVLSTHIWCIFPVSCLILWFSCGFISVWSLRKMYLFCLLLNLLCFGVVIAPWWLCNLICFLSIYLLKLIVTDPVYFQASLDSVSWLVLSEMEIPPKLCFHHNQTELANIVDMPFRSSFQKQTSLA